MPLGNKSRTGYARLSSGMERWAIEIAEQKSRKRHESTVILAGIGGSFDLGVLLAQQSLPSRQRFFSREKLREASCGVRPKTPRSRVSYKKVVGQQFLSTI